MKRRWWVFMAASAAFMLVFAWVLSRSALDDHGHVWQGEPAERDLPHIATDTLRVLVLRDPLVWEPGPGGDMGLAFDWLKRFAKEHELAIRPVPVTESDSLLAALWRGEGDVIAAPLHDDRDLRHHIRLLEPFAEIEPYLASLRLELEPDARLGLEPRIDSAKVARSSPFAHPDYAFARTFRAAVGQAEPGYGEEELLVDVVSGHVPACLVSGLRAAHEAGRFPVLQFEGPVGKPIPWAFAVRRNAPLLEAALRHWQAGASAREAFVQLKRAATGPVPPPGPLRARRMKGLQADSISPFDHYFKTHAQGLSFDWRLLAAMAWKESRFDSTVTSRKGAMGIMQIMPRTAARFGLDTSSAMEDHIRAAAQYMARLDTIWLRAVPDREERLRFVLASYNAGPGHIIDAQRLAGQIGLDPSRWEGHVERAVMLLAKPRYFLRPGMKNGYCKGSQVFNYVRGVLAVHAQIVARTGGVKPVR